MRRIVMAFVLLAGALALATAGLADPGGKGKGKKNGHNRFSAQIVVADHGSCDNVWATDTSTRTWTVKKNNNGSFRVSRRDNGTFVTTAGQSPGACDTTGKHGKLVNEGVHRRVLPGRHVHLLAGLRRLQVQLRVQLAEQHAPLPPLAGQGNERRERAVHRRHRQLVSRSVNGQKSPPWR